MFRSVNLPAGVSGRLYLHSMPGRFEPYQATVDAAAMRGVSQVVCLTSLDEIEGKAPDYARAVQRNNLPWQQVMFPIVDFGVPSDRAALLALRRRPAPRRQHLAALRGRHRADRHGGELCAGRSGADA